MNPPPFDSELLLEQQEWMRRLARRLVGDPAGADDLVQDAWVVALERRPALRAPRAWLAQVVRNLSRQSRRSEIRREDREAASTDREPPVTPDEVERTMSAQREVVDALRELEEPYRTAVFLRFVRGRSFAEIARSEQVPVSTAHSRTKRGLELLRARLDTAHGGDRQAWIVALLPLTRSPLPGGGLETALGGLAVTTAIKVSLTAAATVAGALLLLDATNDQPVAAQRAPAAPPVALEAPVPEPTRPAQATGTREAAAPPTVASTAETATPPTAALRALRGRALSANGEPLAHVDVGRRGPAGWSASTDAIGSFQAELPADTDLEHDVVLRSGDWFTVVPGRAVDAEVVVVGAPEATLRGRVVDAAGEPLTDVRVSLEVEQGLFRDLALDRELSGVWADRSLATTRTDEYGAFELTRACTGPAVYLDAERAGFARGRLPLASGVTDGIEVVLERESGVLVEGLVLDRAGRPVPDAAVTLGGEITRSDIEGRFALDADEVAPDAMLRAVRPGHLPASLPFEPSLTDAPVVLHLGDEPLGISGRVVDPEGTPVPGAIVWASDLEPLGHELHRQGDYAVMLDVSVEETLREGYGSRGVTADDDGRFDLEGLLPRTYALRVLDPATLRRSAALPVEAGTRDAVLAMTSDERLSPIRGRLLDGSGEPFAGASLLVRRFVAESRYGLPPDSAMGPATTETDEEGRFAFDAKAIDSIALTILGDEVEPYLTFRIGPDDDPEDLELVAGRLCELQVVLTSDPGVADLVEVLDADGTPLRLFESFGMFLGARTEAMVREGRTGVLRIDERARILVLRAGEQEVMRLPIELSPTERTTLEL